MDKNAIKKYAVWARRELIERVSQRAMMYGITDGKVDDPNADSVNGHLLSRAEKSQRQALIRKVREQGFEQVMEEVAYTWFNRFAALRFMEVNGYLPSHVRVFTNDVGEFKPQILSEAIHLVLDGLDRNKVYELEGANKSEELFKYLLIVQCNALNSILPGMFQTIEDYTELLLPDYLLRDGSVIEQMVTTIPEEDWTDQVQIIGWLYEAYNSEKNEQVYDGTLSKEKITKELLPAATTIFTPDWPVHYMVENSLGRLWLEGHPNDAMRAEFKYYLDEVEQRSEVEAQLVEIRKEYSALKPEEIKVIDPCCGSGHILCVLFDVLVRIYEDYGYTAREAAALIVEKNLWGLDIDERAAQLSYFAVMMKARQFDRRFFSRGVQPHVYAIEESNGITTAPLHDMGVDFSTEDYGNAVKQVMRLLEETHDAKEYGSIISVTPCDWDLLRRFAVPRCMSEGGQLSFEINGVIDAAARLQELINVGEALAQKYHVVVTNPPYLGNTRFSPALDRFIKENYAEVKSDLSMVMFKHTIDDMVNSNGFVSFITTSSWMFLTSFESLRLHLQNTTSFTSLVDYGTELFEGKVGHNPIVSWVVRKNQINGYKMTAIRLVDYCYSRRDEKEPEFFQIKNRYYSTQSSFESIPGSPIAYWLSAHFIELFHNIKLIDIAKPRVGLQTGENNRFIRLWYETSIEKVFLDAHSREEAAESKRKWFPYNKGGEFRKWYGNNDYVVNWENDGEEIRNFKDSNGKPKSYIRNAECYFQPSVSWSKISSGTIAFRYKPNGHIFDVAGTSIFAGDEVLLYLAGLCNSKVALKVFDAISPTLNYEVGHIASLPIIIDEKQKIKVDDLVKQNIHISRIDWDYFETSWDFHKHPLLPHIELGSESVFLNKAGNNGSYSITYKLSDCYDAWNKECKRKFNQLKINEEELNRIFIDIYGLSEELQPEVEGKDISVRKADLQRDIRSFISYAVGCMLGRYSLEREGLVYAGGDFDDVFRKDVLVEEHGDSITFGGIGIALSREYNQVHLADGSWADVSYAPDADNIIPLCDDDYFEDDIVGRFVKFVEVVYGKDTLEENLRFIADALGGKGTSREVIRNYFINDFYADHLKVYQKRPIYWLFDSGKKNGFKCLIYMHRYQPDTIARIRTDYVHEQQSRYRTVIADLEQRIDSAPTSERVKLSKQLTKVQEQAEELRVYEEIIHHLADQMIAIDLDDGIKVNYAKFQDVLAKIK